MKKVMNKINFALIGLMTVVPAFAAETAGKNDMCALIMRLQGIFKILRTAAFIGAAFYIAMWAWEYIKGGSVDPDKIKKQGIALITGFSLLFMIGVILSFILAMPDMGLLGVECKPELTKGW